MRFNVKTNADATGALNALDAERLRLTQLRLTPDAAAVANVQSASTPANGESVTITDGEGNSEVFEFTTGGGLTVGTIEVDTTGTTTGGMAELKAAIGGSSLNITDGAVAGAGPWDLPLTHNTQGAASNSATLVTDAGSLTLTAWAGGQDGNLTAAAATQTLTVRAGSVNGIVVAAAVKVDTDLSGGAVSAVTVDVGDSGDPDKYIAAEDVFGSGGGFFQGSPGAGFTGLAGLPVNDAGADIEVVVSATGGDVADIDAGDVTIQLWTLDLPTGA